MIGLIGLSHKQSSVDERAHFALSPDEATMLIEEWKMSGYISGAVVLSTCNRMEIYYEMSHDRGGAQVAHLLSSLLEHLELSHRMGHKLIVLEEYEAIVHLFRLASGLESMVLGETQILGQLKDAFKRATKYKQSTAVLSRLYHRAFEVAKRVRSTFTLSATPRSAGSVAVDYVLGQLPNQWKGTVLIIGAGQIAETVYHRLVELQVGSIAIYNRTRERAERFAQAHSGVEVYSGDSLEELLQSMDVIFVATSSQTPIITTDHLQGGGREKWLFDLAVPRNVQEQVASLANVHLYTIDTLKALQNIEPLTKQDQTNIEGVITEVVQQFQRWSADADVRETISQMQEIYQRLLAKEMGQLSKALSEDERTLIIRQCEHFATTITTSIASSMRSLAEGEQTKHWLTGVRALLDTMQERER